jgi:hypothetical protein
VDVRSGRILWPQTGLSRDVPLEFDAEHGDSATVTATLLVHAAHGTVRYLYDCPKAYFHMVGEKRESEMDSY